MAEAPQTRPSLLVRLRDAQDQAAWRDFADLYGPLVYRFGRKNGLQDADAADLTQAVLEAVSSSIGKLDYDSARGTFRGWLFGVVRRQLGKWHERDKRQAHGSGDTADLGQLAQQPAPADDDSAELWEREYKRQRFLWAANRVRDRIQESSWRAFWQTAVEGRDSADVARELGLTVGALYTAKSRVLAHIKNEIRSVVEE
jgi:RNA polymerase sigma-70 factor (ECF subfamily)